MQGYGLRKIVPLIFLRDMLGIRDLINSLQEASDNIKKVDDIVDRVVEEKKDVLLSLNRDQMLLGRDASGEILSPGYTEDPYFKTKKKAESYKRLKQKLESSHKSRLTNVQLYPEKASNTPNLIVTGPFQNEMFITPKKGSYEIGSTYVDAADINTKYNNNVFGLAPKSKEYFYEHFIKPELQKELKL